MKSHKIPRLSREVLIPARNDRCVAPSETIVSGLDTRGRYTACAVSFNGLAGIQHRCDVALEAGWAVGLTMLLAQGFGVARMNAIDFDGCRLQHPAGGKRVDAASLFDARHASNKYGVNNLA